MHKQDVVSSAEAFIAFELYAWLFHDVCDVSDIMLHHAAQRNVQ